MPIIGAAYLRCSDPRQDKSIDQQRAEIERRAAADGVVIPAENWFIDEGISGRSTKRRASYQTLIRRAEAQKEALRGRGRGSVERIERLYVWAFSRIARNMFDCLRAIATLDDADIDIVSLTEHDTGDRSMRKLIRPILAWLAERYSEELSRNVQRGMQSQAARGFWTHGTTAFGYEAVKAEGGQKLVVTERTRDDFELVKRIFRMADETNDGARRIAEQLTLEGIAPPGDPSHPREVASGAWRSRHVHYMLKNRVYCGHIVYKGEVMCRDTHEAAVDDATFERIQAKRALRDRKQRGKDAMPANPIRVGTRGLLTPWLRCGSCGGRIVVVAGGKKGARTYLYYCGTRQDNPAACPGLSVRTDVLDERVMDAIERRVLTTDNVKNLIANTREALANSDVDEAAAERDRLAAHIADLDRKIRLAASSVINGLMEEADAKAITAPLIAQRDTARLQLKALPARKDVPDPASVKPEVFREAVLAAWQARPIAERRAALDKVLDRVTLDEGGIAIDYSLGADCAAGPYGPFNRM